MKSRTKKAKPAPEKPKAGRPRHQLPDTPRGQLARRIRELRIARDLTVAQFAAACEVTIDAVEQWEGGRRRPSLDNLQAVARALRVTVDGLIGE